MQNKGWPAPLVLGLNVGGPPSWHLRLDAGWEVDPHSDFGEARPMHCYVFTPAGYLPQGRVGANLGGGLRVTVRVMVESGIPSAKQKLARAEKHLRALDRAVKKLRRETPYDFTEDYTPNKSGKPDFYLRAVVTAAPPIPESWALITGDILTNARAALDHAVFPHILGKKPTLKPQEINYPICDRKDQFVSKAGWFTPEVADVVEASQPYHFETPAEHPLAALRELVNTGKHRKLVIAEYAMASFRVAPDPRFEVVDTWLQDKPLEVGMTACEVLCRLTKPIRGRSRIDFDAQVEYGEQIEIPKTGRSWNVLSSLKSIVRPIGPLLGRLEAAGC